MSFLDKYAILKKSIPVPANVNRDSIDCDYTNGAVHCKNCYSLFGGYYYENSLYINHGAYNKMLIDCYGMANSEKCYESSDCIKSYNSTFLIGCNSCNDCHFSAYLASCSDCFGCVALTHKKYCIFNKQYNKDEYFKKVEELKKENPEKILSQMLELKKKIPHSASNQFNAQNCPYGNNVYDSKNCYWSFNTIYFENSGYTFNCSRSKNCWDVCEFGGNSELETFSERCYENFNTETTYGCTFLNFSKNCTNSHYSDYLNNCSDCFGCVGLSNKKYCILNNQLTKDQYEKVVREIKRELGWNV